MALDLPESVRTGIATWQSKALGDSALRAMPARVASHHALLSRRSKPERDIPRIEAVIRSLEPRPIELRFESEPMAVPRAGPASTC